MDTLDRIYVAWEVRDDVTYFITSLDLEFGKHLQEMVADLGRPTKVEFRAADEGWYLEDYEQQTRDDYEEIVDDVQ
jgi:hypothetical protein